MAAAVVRKELGDAVDRVAKLPFIGKEDHAEVVGLRPVEARALNEDNVRGFKKLLKELAVVLDRIDIRVESREHVEGCRRTNDGNARNGG